MEYYIYHIAGVKIGCTSQLEIRMQQQGFTEWEILETHTDGWHAGDREIELQKEYDLPVDKVHYMIARQNMQKAQRVANNGWQTGDQAARGRRNKGRKRPDLARNNVLLKSKLTQEQAENIRASNDSRANLAKKYNVSIGTIRNIIFRKTYV
tara:strand:+ start:48 stop:503 length:456 start_codon:yes stop_codon:yes gene_type:complete